MSKKKQRILRGQVKCNKSMGERLPLPFFELLRGWGLVARFKILPYENARAGWMGG